MCHREDGKGAGEDKRAKENDHLELTILKLFLLYWNTQRETVTLSRFQS